MTNAIAPQEMTDTLPEGIPERTLGWEALAFAAKYLRHVDGNRAGQRWEFTPRQARFILWYYAVDEEGDWLYGHAARRLAKGPIAHSEMVPTPSGWKKHGDLQVWDDVYAVDGSVTKVVELGYEVNEDCYRITFSDDTSVKSTGSHRWPVDALVGNERVRKIVTVDEMLKSGLAGDELFYRTLPTPLVKECHNRHLGHRFITDIEPIESEPARCITVAHDSHQYLVGNGWVPTCNSGKSPFAAVMAIVEFLAPVRFAGWDDSLPGKCYGKRVDMPLVQLVAASLSQPLALDTEVRTIDGWKIVGDLHVGDFVYGSDGLPAEVKRETEVFYDRECFRVEFDDGTSIVADAGHGWTVQAKNGHGDGFDTVTMTTQQMKDYKESRKRGSLRIPTVPVHFPEKELEVDPYILGFWLGDGSRNNGSFAIDWRLKDELETIFRRHLLDYEDLRFAFAQENTGTVNVKRRDGICPRGHEYFNDLSNQSTVKGNPACRKCYMYPRAGYNDPELPALIQRLRSIGVLKNKHIPDCYLNGSYDQRMELLRGLMDSDGSINKDGRAIFTNKDRRLIEGIESLLDSLGFKWKEYPATNGAARVDFIPRAGEYVFKFEYKKSRQREVDHPLSVNRRVTAIVPVESVPVKCIGIDNEDHLFQATRRGVLTHNTENTMSMIQAMLSPHNAPQLREDYSLDVGKTQITTEPWGKLEVVSSSPRSVEGARVTCVIADELEHWTPSTGGVKLFTTLKANLTKTGNRMIETLNSWEPDVGSAGELTFKAWCGQMEGSEREIKRGILYDAVMAPFDTDISDETSLRKGLEYVYADCPWSLEHLDAIISDFYTSSTPLAESKRKYLNHNVAAEDAWADPKNWALMADRSRKVADGEDIVMFFDGSLSRDATALVGACVSDGHVFTIGIWEPGNKHSGANKIDARAVDARVEWAFQRYNVRAFFADVNEWDGYVKNVWAERYADRLDIWATPSAGATGVAEPIAWDMRSKTMAFTMACELVEAEILDGAFTHDGDPILARHVANARRHENRWGIDIRKESKDSARKIDAAVCMIGARHALRVLRENGGTPATYEAFFY